jgi:hypothetical protein
MPFRSERLSEKRKGYNPTRKLDFGCHGYGFAWPCFRYEGSTAMQSHDRGTLKTRLFFPDSLSLRAARGIIIIGTHQRGLVWSD